MQGFIQRHTDKVSGVLSGFDRVRLRGTLRWLSNPRGMLNYLSCVSVLLKDFKEFAMDCTTRIRRASQCLALSDQWFNADQRCSGGSERGAKVPLPNRHSVVTYEHRA